MKTGSPPHSSPEPDVRSDAEPRTIRWRVPDMDCPSCVAKIQSRLTKVDGVLDVTGSPVQRTITVRLDPSLVHADRVTSEIGRLGYSALRTRSGAMPPPAAATWRSGKAKVAYVSMVMFVAGWMVRLLDLDAPVTSAPLPSLGVPEILFLGAAVVGGSNFFPKGLRSARTLSLDMNFLMTVAIIGAIGIGEYVEAAAIAFLFGLAELLERYSVDRARASVDALMELAPETARLKSPDGTERVVAAADLEPGHIVTLRPGDRVSADGTVVEGVSAVDESTVTGESMPVDKTVGSEVFAGTINRDGFLAVRVSRRAAESTLARIVRMVEEAEASKTRAERFIERFARWYTPAITLAAVLTVAVPVLLGAPFAPWFIRGLTLLVIACPCALVISTPVAVVSGVTSAARNGVLIKGGTHLESLGAVRVIALDKTGTLTLGHPTVTAVLPTGDADEGELLSKAAAVESRSEHPVGRAICERAAELGPTPFRSVTEFKAVPGRGVRAMVDGVEHVVGKPSFVAPDVPVPSALRATGKTVVGVTAGGRFLGWIAVSDLERTAAAGAVRRLRAEGIEKVVMLTGDRRETADAIAARLGIDEVWAELLPKDKVDAVRELEERYGPVAMVGDGVNDAPALAAATVGIVMGAAGSDAALEAADIALMGDDLSRLPYVRALSRKARRVIRQNIAAALVVKAVLAVGVPLGFVSLVTAVVVGDMGVSLAVTANSLRLARLRG